MFDIIIWINVRTLYGVDYWQAEIEGFHYQGKTVWEAIALAVESWARVRHFKIHAMSFDWLKPCPCTACRAAAAGATIDPDAAAPPPAPAAPRS